MSKRCSVEERVQERKGPSTAKKRVLGFSLALAMLLVLLPAAGMPAAFAATEGDWEYTVDLTAQTATITKYIGKSGEVDFPPTLGGLTIAGISGGAFRGNTLITSITIPALGIGIIEEIRNSVSEAGAFRNCTSLARVVLPDGLKRIGRFTFSGCSSLTDVKIPTSVTEIDYQAFIWCTSLTNITIPKNVKRIETATFYGCTSLSSFIIPSSVEYLGNEAFSDCKALTSMTIPSSVEVIDAWAFSGCTSLSSLTILNRSVKLNSSIVENCLNLTIHCYRNSKAHEFCINNEFPFVLLPDNYTAPTSPPISVLLDGSPLVFDVPPQLINGRTMVPLRTIFEALGAEIKWDDATQTVTATKDDTVIKLTIGSTSPTVNGKVVTIDQPGVIVDGRTLVPLRFVAEALGVTVNWDGATSKVTIKSSAED